MSTWAFATVNAGKKDAEAPVAVGKKLAAAETTCQQPGKFMTSPPGRIIGNLMSPLSFCLVFASFWHAHFETTIMNPIF